MKRQNFASGGAGGLVAYQAAIIGNDRSRGAMSEDPEPGIARPAELGGSTSAAAYETLFRQHFSGMVALADLLGADDAENIAQEAFVRLHAKQRMLRDPAAARAYLRTTVVNLTRSGHRHLSVVRRHTPAESVGPRGVEDTVVASLGNVAVLTALRTLSPRHREALVLRYWAELSEREMADAMRVSVGTVKSHVSRGLVALEAALTGMEVSS
ncbi:RNA polymerase sigma factor (sigma-70 family) [Nakamurella sp. UYEF19]|uniref:RNA polymerase sigma factor n=1 Tax=Nakamurella sp. UYEF19 TaxID=1756392 RepID=UPI00339A2773